MSYFGQFCLIMSLVFLLIDLRLERKVKALIAVSQGLIDQTNVNIELTTKNLRDVQAIFARSKP